MHAASVEYQGCGRHEIGAEANRSDEPVFDPDQRDLLPRGRFDKSSGHARGPYRDGLVRVAAGRLESPRAGPAKNRRAGARTKKVGNPAALPERHADQDRDTAIGTLDWSPVGED